MPKDRDEQNSGQFSLEEILAEYRTGGPGEERGEAADTLPVPPKRERPAPPGEERPREERQRRAREESAPPPRRRERPTPPRQEQERPPRERAPEKERAPEREKPRKAAPAPKPDNVVAFPGGAEEREDPAAAPPAQEDKVLEFPGEEEETFFTAKLNAIRRRADEYAEHMFEQEGAEADPEVRRVEKYIPGVDVEETPEQPIRRERRPRRSAPAAPDLPPEELYRRYGKGMPLLRLRIVLVFLLALPMLYLTLAPHLGIPLPGVLGERYDLQCGVLAALLGCAMLLGCDQLWAGLARIARLRLGLDTLLSLACLVTLADALTLQRLAPRDGQLPYCAVCTLALGFAMRGTGLKRRGLRQACRAASAAQAPYLVTLDEGKWNGRGAYAKWSGVPVGFGSQIQADDGAQRIFAVVSPLLLIACILFSLMASVGRQRPGSLLWCLSATLTAASTFSGTLCYGKPWCALSRRLAKSGAALAGWDGAAAGGRAGILLTDADLFPPGTVTMNGIKVFGDFPVDRVVGYTASMIREMGCGLDKIFHDLLRSQGAIYRRAGDFQYHEGGGVSGVIQGQNVLVGTAAFMHLMEVTLPQGLNVKNAVFCAIDRELAGIFALNYTLHPSVQEALTALTRGKVGPVLATRDFNLNPAMLRQRFKLPVEKMEYPAVARRVELSDPNQEHSETLSAVLCREGLYPFSEAVIGGRRLRSAVRLTSILAAVGGAVGALLAFYLTSVQAFSSLSPVNLLIFLLMWLVPTLLISNWVNRY